jgi:hypothetical protein
VSHNLPRTILVRQVSTRNCLPCRIGPGKGKKYWYLFDPKHHKGLELPKKERGIFDQKQIQTGELCLNSVAVRSDLAITAEFDELTEDTEREIFRKAFVVVE